MPANAGVMHHTPTPDGDHSDGDIFVEIVEDFHKGAEKAESAAKNVKRISAYNAFRKYDWLRDKVILNAKRDLRGIVVDAKFRTAYEWSKKAEERLGDVAALLSLAVEIYNSRKEAADIWNSSDDDATKFARASAMASGICTRALWGMGSGVADSALAALKATKYVNPGYWFDAAIGDAQYFDEGVDSLRSQIKHWTVSVDDFLSDGKLYHFITIHATL